MQEQILKFVSFKLGFLKNVRIWLQKCLGTRFPGSRLFACLKTPSKRAYYDPGYPTRSYVVIKEGNKRKLIRHAHSFLGQYVAHETKHSLCRCRCSLDRKIFLMPID